jgi:tetratricopeptide (TPR) repeat protein
MACSAIALPEIVCAQSYPGVIPGSINPLSTDQGRPYNTMPSAMPKDKPGLILGDKEPDAGWDGLAKLLEAISPSVDTRIPLTPSDITTRIEGLLRVGRNQEALEELDKRLAVEAQRKTPGTDVQLMFQQARVMTALKRLNEAEAIYQKMTMRFPELPEPWNNLAVIYVQRGELDQARRALEMAIMINPNYAFAQSNLGDVQLSIALLAYQRAAAAGAPGARAKARAVSALIEENAEAAPK